MHKFTKLRPTVIIKLPEYLFGGEITFTYILYSFCNIFTLCLIFFWLACIYFSLWKFYLQINIGTWRDVKERKFNLLLQTIKALRAVVERDDTTMSFETILQTLRNEFPTKAIIDFKNNTISVNMEGFYYRRVVLKENENWFFPSIFWPNALFNKEFREQNARANIYSTKPQHPKSGAGVIVHPSECHLRVSCV